MKPTTARNLLLLCIFLDVALLGVVLWDYFKNDSDLIVIVLAVFAVFVVITAILFFLAGRGGKQERVVVRVVEKEHAPTQPGQVVHVHHEHHHEHPGIAPPIPPAPLRTQPSRLANVAVPRPATPTGPFRYKGYTLHSRGVKLANAGGTRTIYFFSKKKPKSGKPCAKPSGYHVGVNERTGLPFLKKGAGPDGEDLTPVSEQAYRPQCSAVTADGAQCRNSARHGSKYCGPHFGYQPPTTKGLAQRIEGEDWDANDKQTDAATVREADTRARVKAAPDTKPSVRKSWFGRRSSN